MGLPQNKPFNEGTCDQEPIDLILIVYRQRWRPVVPKSKINQALAIRYVVKGEHLLLALMSLESQHRKEKII